MSRPNTPYQRELRDRAYNRMMNSYTDTYLNRDGEHLATIDSMEWKRSSYMVHFVDESGHKGRFNIKPYLQMYSLDNRPVDFGRLTAAKRQCIEDTMPESIHIYTEVKTYYKPNTAYNVGGYRVLHYPAASEMCDWIHNAFELAYDRNVLLSDDYKLPLMSDIMKDQCASYIDKYNDCVKSMSEKLVKKRMAERSFLKHDYDEPIQQDKDYLDKLSKEFSQNYHDVSLEDVMISSTGQRVIFEHGNHRVYVSDPYYIRYENLNTGEKTYAEKVNDEEMDAPLYKRALKKAVREEAKRQEYEQKKAAFEQIVEEKGLAVGAETENNLEV